MTYLEIDEKFNAKSIKEGCVLVAKPNHPLYPQIFGVFVRIQYELQADFFLFGNGRTKIFHLGKSFSTTFAGCIVIFP